MVGTRARSVLGRSGGRGRNRRRGRERNRITALLPLWLLWLLRTTTTSPAVPTRVERLRLGEQLLLRTVLGAENLKSGSAGLDFQKGNLRSRKAWLPVQGCRPALSTSIFMYMRICGP